MHDSDYVSFHIVSDCGAYYGKQALSMKRNEVLGIMGCFGDCESLFTRI